MFEKWIAGQLMHLLGEYLEPSSFSTETLSVGVWSGYVVLDNVRLKQGLLDVAPLPVHMTHGSVARIELRIPWSNLTREPIELTIHGVYIVFRAEIEDMRIPGKAAKEARKQAIKKARLSSAYMRRMDTLEESGQQQKRLGMRFLERLLHRFLDSILVHVQGVHIRYEDAISNPLHPFCTGVTLASLHVCSADTNSFPNSLETTLERLPYRPNVVPLLAKTLQLSHLSVYWNAAQFGNPCSMFVGEGLEENNHDAVASIMHLLVPRPDLNSLPGVTGYSSDLPPLGHNYLLAPVDATGNILLFEGDAQYPATWTVDAHVGSVTVSVYDWQYQDILCMAASQAQYEARLKYQTERPHVDVMVDPKAWWGYAIATAIEEVKRVRNNGVDCWDLRDIGRRRALRLEYICLWSSSIKEHLNVRASSGVTTQHGGPSSYIETGKGQQPRQYCSRLEELERKLSYDDIIMFRAMAQKEALSELRAQREGTDGVTGLQQEKQVQSVISSWVLWALGVHTEEGKYSTGSSIPLGSSDADFESLCDMIDWDPTEVLSLAATTKPDYSNLKNDILRLRLNFQLDCGSLSVRCCDMEDFVDLRFRGLDARCSVLGENQNAIEVTVLLEDLGIYEIGRNGDESVILQRRKQDPEELELVSGPLIGGEGRHLLRITVASNMEHCNNHDLTLALSVGQVEIILSPESMWMELISAFIEPPEFLEYWEGLELDAANTLSSVTAQLEAKFHYFVDTRYRALVDVDAMAPLVIIPVESGTTECITFDLGRVTFKTQKLATPDPSVEAIAAASAAEKQEKSSSSSSSKSPSSSNKLHFPPFHSLYDAYLINIQQVELSYITGDGMEYTLLNPLDIRVELYFCLIPRDPAMTQLWIRGDLPEVHLRLSDYIMNRLIAAGRALSRKACAASDGASVVSHTRSGGGDFSENERGGALTMLSTPPTGLASFLDFQRTIGEYVDQHIDSSHAALNMQSGAEGGDALISVQQQSPISSISACSRSEWTEPTVGSDEESFFDAISEYEESWSVDDETSTSSRISEKESCFSLDIQDREQLYQKREVGDDNIKGLNDIDIVDQQPFQTCISSSLPGEIKEETDVMRSMENGEELQNLEIMSDTSSNGGGTASEDHEPRRRENHLLTGVENSCPAVAQIPENLELSDSHDDLEEEEEEELFILPSMYEEETRTQGIWGLDVPTSAASPVMLETSHEKMIEARNNIERRASKSVGFIPLNRDILRSTFTLPLVNIEIVRSGDSCGRTLSNTNNNNVAAWTTTTTTTNDMEMEIDDNKPILNVKFTGIDVRVHARTDDARLTLSVGGLSIMDCLKELRGVPEAAVPDTIYQIPSVFTTAIEEKRQKRHHYRSQGGGSGGKGSSNSLHHLFSISSSFMLLSSKPFRPNQWIPERLYDNDVYLDEELRLRRSGASGSVSSSHYCFNSKCFAVGGRTPGVRKGISDFFHLSLIMSKSPLSEECSKSTTTTTTSSTEVEKCQVSIDLNALEFAIEPSSASAVLELLGNMLDMEDSSDYHQENSSNRQCSAPAAPAAPASIKISSRELFEPASQSFSSEIEHIQSVRVNIGTIAVYLVQDGLDIAAVILRGAKCLLETDKSGKIHVWLKCMNLQVLDLISDEEGDTITTMNNSAVSSASASSSVAPGRRWSPSQWQSHNDNSKNSYGIGGGPGTFNVLNSPTQNSPAVVTSTGTMTTPSAQELLGTMDENTPMLDVCFMTQIDQIFPGRRTAAAAASSSPSSLKIFIGSFRVVVPSPTFCDKITRYVLLGPLFPYLIQIFGGFKFKPLSPSSSTQATATVPTGAESTRKTRKTKTTSSSEEYRSSSSSSSCVISSPYDVIVSSTSSPSWQIPSSGLHVEFSMKKPLFILPISWNNNNTIEQQYYHYKKANFFVLSLSQLFVGASLRPLQDSGGMLVGIESGLVGLSVTLEPENEGILLPLHLNLSMCFMQQNQKQQPPPHNARVKSTETTKIETITGSSSSHGAAAVTMVDRNHQNITTVEDTIREDGAFLWERLVEHFNCEDNFYFSTAMTVEENMSTRHLSIVSWSSNGSSSNLIGSTTVGTSSVSVSASASRLKLYSCNAHLEILLSCIKCWTKCFKSIKQQYYMSSASGDRRTSDSSCNTVRFAEKDDYDQYQTRAAVQGRSLVVIGEANISVEAVEFTLFGSACHSGHVKSPILPYYHVEKMKDDEMNLNIRERIMTTTNISSTTPDSELPHHHCQRGGTPVPGIQIVPVFHFIAMEIEIKVSSSCDGGMVPALSSSRLEQRQFHKEQEEESRKTEAFEECYSTTLSSLTIRRIEATVPEGGGWSMNTNKWHRRNRKEQQQQHQQNYKNPFFTRSSISQDAEMTTSTSPTPLLFYLWPPLEVTDRDDHAPPPPSTTPITSTSCSNNSQSNCNSGRYGLIIRIWDCVSSSGNDNNENLNNCNSMAGAGAPAAWKIQCLMGRMSIAVLPQLIRIAAPTILTFLPLISNIATLVQTKNKRCVISSALTLRVDTNGMELWLPAEKTIAPEGKSLVLSWYTSSSVEWSSTSHDAGAGALSTPFEGWISVKKCQLGIRRLKWMMDHDGHDAEIKLRATPSPPLHSGDTLSSYFDETIVRPFSCTSTFTRTLPDLVGGMNSSDVSLLKLSSPPLPWSNEFHLEMDIIEGTWHIDSSLPINVWFASVEPLISEKWWGGGPGQPPRGPRRPSADDEEVITGRRTETIPPDFSPVTISKELVGVSGNGRSDQCSNSGHSSIELGSKVIGDAEVAKVVDNNLPTTTIPSSPKLYYPWKVHVALQGIRIWGLHSSYTGCRGALKGTPVALFELFEVEGGALIVGNKDIVSMGGTTTECQPSWPTARAWIETKIHLDYFNRSSSAWEPLLEPWGVRADATASWIMSREYKHNQSNDPQPPHHHQSQSPPLGGDLSPPTSVNIDVTAKQVLNVNVTEGLIDTVAGMLRALEKNPLLNLASIPSIHSSSPIVTTNPAAAVLTTDPYCDTRALSTSSPIAGMIDNESGMTLAVLCFAGKDAGMIIKDDFTTTKCCFTEKSLMLPGHLLLAEREVLSGDSIPLMVTYTNEEKTTEAPSTWRNQDSPLLGNQRGSGYGGGDLFVHLSYHRPGYPSWKSASPLSCSQLGYREHLLRLHEGAMGSGTATYTSLLRLYVDVRVKAGAMFITVHSALRLANQTSVPLHVSFGIRSAISTSCIESSNRQTAVDWHTIIAPGRREPVPALLFALVSTTPSRAPLSIYPILEMEQNQADNNNALTGATIFTPVTIQLPRIMNNKGSNNNNEKRSGGIHERENSNILGLEQLVIRHFRELKFFPNSSTTGMTGGDGVAGSTIGSNQKKMCCLAAVTESQQHGVELVVCPPVFIRNFLAVSTEVEISPVNEQQQPKDSPYGQQRSVTTTLLSIDSGSAEMWTGCMLQDTFTFRIRMNGYDWSTQCVVAQPSSSVEIKTSSSRWSTVQEHFVDGIRGNGESGIVGSSCTLCQLWVDVVDMCSKAKLRLRVEVSTDTMGIRDLSIWVPYWVVNSSGLPLELALDKGAAVEGDRGHGGPGVTFSRTRGNSLFEQQHLSAIPVGRNVEDRVDATRRACGEEHHVRSKAGTFLISRWQPCGIGIKSVTRWVKELKEGDDIKKHQFRSGGGVVDQQGSSVVSISAPLMMDYTTEPEEFNGRGGCAFVRARVPGASWSSPFSCDQAGVEGALEIRGRQTSILSRFLPNRGSQKGEVVQAKKLMGHGSQAFALGLSIKVAEGGFHRTKVLTLIPRYIVVNEMDGPIEVNQALTRGRMRQEMVVEGCSITVSSGGQLPWHWPLASGLRLLRCRMDEFGCEWSGPFDPSRIGDQNLRLFNKYGHTLGLCRVDVDLKGPIIFLVFHKVSPNMAPYRIENSSIHVLTVGQVGCKQVETLEPYTSCSYAWDEPLGKHLLRVMLQKRGDGISRLLGLYPLDEVRLFNAASNLKVEVIAVGPARVLRFSHNQGSCSIGPHHHHRSNSTISLSDGEPLVGGGGNVAEEVEALGDSGSTRQTQNHRRHRSTSFLHAIAGTVYGRLTEEQQQKEEQQQSQYLQTAHITLSTHLRGIGLSLVNATPRELMYVTIGGIRIEFASQGNQHTISVTVRHLQVDNQFFRTPYPLLLYPLNTAIPNASSTVVLDSMHCISNNSNSVGVGEGLRVTMIVEQSSCSEGTDCSCTKFFSVKLLRISLAPLDVNLDGSLVMALLRMYSRATETLTFVGSSTGGGSSSGSVAGRLGGQNVITAQEVLLSLTPPILYRHHPPTLPSAKLYFEELIIDPIRFHVSFRLEGVYDPLDHVDPEDEDHGNIIAVCGSANSEYCNVMRDFVAPSVSARPSPPTSALVPALIMSMGAQLASIENVSLALNALVLTHTFASAKDLGKQLSCHYQRQVLFRAFKIIGSAELLGNPVAFLQNVASGVKDFLYEPVAGLREGSMEGFIFGVVKGTSSLLSRTTYSLAETLQLIAGKFSSFLLVSGYVALPLPNPSPHRSDSGGWWARHGGRSARRRYMTTKWEWFQPSGLFSGVCLGLVGLARDPLLGFVKGGFKGLITGMCRGGLGLFFRPAYGGLVAIESMGRYVCQFLYPTLGPAQKHRMQRVRPPRFFRRRHQPVTIFSWEENAGEELLSRAAQGRHRMEGYVWHEVVGTRTYVLTRQTLLVLHQTDSLFNPSVEITIPLCCVVWAEVVEDPDNGSCGVGIYDIGNDIIGGDKTGFQGLCVRYTTVHSAQSKKPHELLDLIFKHHSS